MQIWEQLREKHRGKTFGVLAGGVLGIIYLFFGLWRMLIFVLIVYTGYYIGKKLDRNEPVFPIEDTWRWLMDKWRLFR
ncbi:small integral membrane protein [Paenibacillus naphthalenovorans]|uniref:Small integral membrane protein n=2 Tax=Paenibacillus naphthalenovorans TaxID=162209 RepID=A0A0U2VTF2_9BACL|nr:small integral membrane protein [Paenibacillus naphthalenovorans]